MALACNIVTIVVPVFNRSNLVVETLDSIACQTALPSLIIVDNNSTDNTMSVITEWAQENRKKNFPIKILSEPNQGAAQARNRGLSEVDTPWTLFFDSDDIMLPCHIQNLICNIENNPKANLIGWNVIVTSLSGKKYIKHFPRKRHMWHNIFNGIMSTQQYAATTSLFQKCGGWNPELTGWDDYELGMRLLLCKPSIMYIKSKPAIEVRCQENSITGTSFRSSPAKWENSLNSCQTIFQQASMPRYARYINLKRAVLAAIYKKEGDTANSKRLMAFSLSNECSSWKKLLLHFAFNYTACGGRGIHWLIAPLI